MLAYYAATLLYLPLSFVTAASFQTSYTGLTVYADQHGNHRASVLIIVKDPATSNQTNCRADWTEGTAPSNWVRLDASSDMRLRRTSADFIPSIVELRLAHLFFQDRSVLRAQFRQC
jgi:hypothetical protein